MTDCVNVIRGISPWLAESRIEKVDGDSVGLTTKALNCKIVAVPKLIPQAVHKDLCAVKIVDGVPVDHLISQRDCVENLVRNVFNVSFSFANGKLRPGVESLLLGTALGRYFTKCMEIDLVSSEIDCGRHWLDETIGFERFGVIYNSLHGNREVLTGIDNILSLMEGMTQKSVDNVHQKDSADQFFSMKGVVMAADNLETVETVEVSKLNPRKETMQSQQQSESIIRASRLTKLCSLLTTETMRVSWNYSPNILNYADITFSYRFHDGLKKCTAKVKWLITTEHVCLRHGSEICC
jgi:hypothetical protein